ncbi:MAG: hypothetical protein OXN17_17040 [Candidatus Poribacteria bacterium]|nr:hypothetical protein [Candidatus Poribacteria bacterium]
MDELIASLTAASHPPIQLFGKGGSLLILPHGGRTLGLYNRDGHNFFWVNPDLNHVTTAESFFTKEGWKNSGGDRTWVSPEVELFISDIENPGETYQVPSSLDPGNYTVQHGKGQVTLTNRARVILNRQEKTSEIELSKTIRMAQNPLRYERSMASPNRQLQFVGYEQLTSLRLVSAEEPGIRLGIWNLVQVPAGGEIVIPTVRESAPKTYFGGDGASDLYVSPESIRFPVDAKHSHKIGVRAATTSGRIGYLRNIGDGQKTLVVRNFLVAPSAEYVDVPWDDLDDFGYAIQCYNDNGDLGEFGEMEYHTPAIGDGTGMCSYQDRSQVWAFLGDAQPVNEVFTQLLGVAPNSSGSKG